jgi:hypothetical protein
MLIFWLILKRISLKQMREETWLTHVNFVTTQMGEFEREDCFEICRCIRAGLVREERKNAFYETLDLK